jgi:hypothetical protein
MSSTKRPSPTRAGRPAKVQRPNNNSYSRHETRPAHPEQYGVAMSNFAMLQPFVKPIFPDSDSGVLGEEKHAHASATDTAMPDMDMADLELEPCLFGVFAENLIFNNTQAEEDCDGGVGYCDLENKFRMRFLVLRLIRQSSPSEVWKQLFQTDRDVGLMPADVLLHVWIEEAIDVLISVEKQEHNDHNSLLLVDVDNENEGHDLHTNNEPDEEYDYDSLWRTILRFLKGSIRFVLLLRKRDMHGDTETGRGVAKLIPQRLFGQWKLSAEAVVGKLLCRKKNKGSSLLIHNNGRSNTSSTSCRSESGDDSAQHDNALVRQKRLFRQQCIFLLWLLHHDHGTELSPYCAHLLTPEEDNDNDIGNENEGGLTSTALQDDNYKDEEEEQLFSESDGDDDYCENNEDEEYEEFVPDVGDDKIIYDEAAHYQNAGEETQEGVKFTATRRSSPTCRSSDRTRHPAVDRRITDRHGHHSSSRTIHHDDQRDRDVDCCLYNNDVSMKSSDETEKEHYSALMEATLAAENEAQAYADRQDQRESKRGAIQAQELADARFAQALAAQDGNENVHDADVDAHEHSCTEEELEAEAAGPMNSCVAAEEKYWNNETTRADHDDSEHKHENERRKAQALADARFARALAAQDDKKNVHDVNVDVDAHEHSCTEEESEAEAAGPMNTFVAAENWNETRADHDSEHENERRKAQASADARLARALASQGRGRGQGVDVDTDDEDYAYTDEEVEAAQFQMCCYGVRNDSSAEVSYIRHAWHFLCD